MHNDNALIEKLGGERVRERFELSPQALNNWRKRGIPVAKKLAFKEWADANGVGVPHDFMAVFSA